MHSRFYDKLRHPSPLFAVTVLLPTLLAVIYYGFLASDVYVSQSSFVVRSPDKPSATGFGALLQTAGFSNASDEVHAAQDFMTSRDALRKLNGKSRFEQSYTAPGVSIFDRFNPTGLYGSFEDLFGYFQGKVRVDYDVSTSITTLTVRAYNAKDAALFNAELLNLAEVMVNKLNVRGREDLIKVAEREVYEAAGSARSSAGSLAGFRNRSGVVDPERQAQIQLQMISKLQDELIGAETQLRQLRELAPENPQVPLLVTKISELRRQIDQQSGSVAGDQRSLAANAAEYSRRELDQEVSSKRLAAAMQSLNEARNEARRKQAYVERIVSPNVPDRAIEPRRLRGILVTLLLGLVAYGLLSMLLAGMREHRIS
jgi:capsular polysaccharide transport system permease protein